MWTPGRAAVGAEGDPHASRGELRQIAGLDPKRLLGVRPVGGRVLQFLQLLGRHGAAQPAEVGRDASVGKIRHEDDVRPRLDQRDECLVDVFVAHPVGEGVEPGFQQPHGILEREDVRRDAERVLVGLIDHCAIQIRRELLVFAVAVVNPDLDQVDLLRGELLHGLPSFRLGRNPVGRFRTTGLRHGDPASRRAKPRGAGNRLVPHLERRVIRVLAEAQDRGDAVVRLALQLIHKGLSRLCEVRVCVDDRRHDRFARQVHASRARGRLHLTRSADLGEPRAIDDEDGIFDGRVAIADNEPRSFEHRDGCQGRRLGHRW